METRFGAGGGGGV
ncbi:hypothetical protein VCHC06A1_1545, partial [Vibrio cholerae HC-06A1]